MEKKYKISIITVVKNSASTIERCIKSVLSQDYQNCEYIIIDSNSTDGTSEIVSKYKDKIIFIREKDNNLWDAMNKGIRIASGETLGFLNADDFYYSGSLKIVNKYFNEMKIDFLFGTVKKYKLMHGFNPKIIKWSFWFLYIPFCWFFY